jgi:hypothetical protein
VFIRPERSLLVRLLAAGWRLRTELAALVLGVWGWLWLTDRLPRWAAVAVVAIVVVGVMAWGPSRRFVVGHVWCTVTRLVEALSARELATSASSALRAGTRRPRANQAPA